MIQSFKCKETEKIWQGSISIKLPRDIQQTARRKLRMLNSAKQLGDLRIPPNNCFEALKGNRRNQFSIRINKQWRICFKWKDAIVFEVEIVDYH